MFGFFKKKPLNNFWKLSGYLQLNVMRRHSNHRLKCRGVLKYIICIVLMYYMIDITIVDITINIVIQ